jgi:cytochrome c-type biogenesis protein CcmH
MKLLTILVLFFPLAICSEDAIEKSLADQNLEKLAYQIFQNVKCTVCSGQSIAESNSKPAQDMRTMIRKKLHEGITREQIERELVKEYGAAILFTPPDKLFLWYLPFILPALIMFYLIIRSIYYANLRNS